MKDFLTEQEREIMRAEVLGGRWDTVIIRKDDLLALLAERDQLARQVDVLAENYPAQCKRCPARRCCHGDDRRAPGYCREVRIAWAAMVSKEAAVPNGN